MKSGEDVAMIELIWDKERSGTATAPSGASITVGEGADFSPDDLLAAAAAGCLMRAFLTRAQVEDVPILSYASASYVEAGPTRAAARVVIRCYVVTTEAGSVAEVKRLLYASLSESPICRLLGESAECRADIRRLCGTCTR